MFFTFTKIDYEYDAHLMGNDFGTPVLEPDSESLNHFSPWNILKYVESDAVSLCL